MECDCLAIDVTGGDDVFIEDDEVSYAAASERFDAVRAHTAAAQHEDSGCSELVECGAPHDDLELGVASLCDRGAVWHVQPPGWGSRFELATDLLVFMQRP